MTTECALDAARGTERQDEGNRGIAILVICGAQLMIALDIFIVNVSLPTIHADLHFAVSNLEWLVSGYSLTFGGLLLFGGRLGDLYGKRRVFMVGVAVFTAASLLAGLAIDDVWLVIARGMQGIGAAIVAPTALSLIATNFAEGTDRNHAMGVYTMMSAGGGAVGLLLGGVLTSYVSWRWIFIVNVPIGAIILYLTPRSVNESPPLPGRLDVPGAVAATGGMLALVYGLSNASSNAWGSASTLVPLALSVVLLGTFGLIESRRRAPLLPLGIFANRNRSACYAIMMCMAVALFTMYFFLTQFLQNVLGWSPIKTGLGFLPAMASVSLSAALTSRILLKKCGIQLPLGAGLVLAVIGLAWISRIGVTSSYFDALGPLILAEVGIGLSFVTLALTVVSGVRSEETGLASALLNCTQQVGGALGVAVLSTVALHATRAEAARLAGGHAQRGLRASAIATTRGYEVAFFVCAVIVFAGLIISLLGIRSSRPDGPGARRTGSPLAEVQG